MQSIKEERLIKYCDYLQVCKSTNYKADHFKAVWPFLFCNIFKD